MRRALLLVGLSVLGALLFASVALAQDDSSASASASSSATASASVDGAVGYPPPGVGTPLASLPPPLGTAVASGSATASAAVGAGGALPATGGEGVAIVAGALLLGAGVLSYAIVRRTS